MFTLLLPISGVQMTLVRPPHEASLCLTACSSHRTVRREQASTKRPGAARAFPERKSGKAVLYWMAGFGFDLLLDLANTSVFKNRQMSKSRNLVIMFVFIYKFSNSLCPQRKKRWKLRRGEGSPEVTMIK